FHRRIKDLLDRWQQPVDFVDEQHVPGLQVRQDGREVAGALNHWTGCGAEPNAHLTCDNLRERRLAQAGWTVQQNVVQSLATRAGGGDEDAEVLPRCLLADEFSQCLGPQRRLGGVLLLTAGRYGTDRRLVRPAACPRPLHSPLLGASSRNDARRIE